MARLPEIFNANKTKRVCGRCEATHPPVDWTGVHNHASYDEPVYELTIQDQPLNIAMESLLWQESLQQPMKVLGAQAGFATNRKVGGN